MKLRYVISIAAITILGVAVAQENPKSNPTHGQSIHTPDKIVWKAGPASLPPGAKMVVLEGDPAKEGPFTMRVTLPDGFTIPPHTHPGTEHITVLSGIFNFGMGEKFDKSATQAMPAGTFGHWPAGMKHFAWANGDTVLQLHGIGPWRIDYVNPSDDPRKSK